MYSGSAIRRIANVHNLYSAWGTVRQAKDTSKGTDGVSISDFGRKIRHHIECVRRGILDGTYEFSELVPFPIQKDDGGYRPLSIPTVSDRLAMRATYNVISPDFADLKSPCSFGYLPGVKLEDAVRRIHQLHESGRTYVLEADIQRFFDSVGREKLLAILQKRYHHDRPLFELLARAVQVVLADQSHLTEEQRAVFPRPGVGIPQGGGLSPLFANLYLLPLDNAMVSNGFGMVRWADDFIVLTKGPQEAEEAYHLAESLLGELGLRLHLLGDSAKDKTRICRYSSGFDFLGLRFDSEGVRPAREKVNAFQARVRRITSSASNLRELLTEMSLYVSGWRGSYKFCDTNVKLSMWQSLDEVVADHLKSGMARFDAILPPDLAPAAVFAALGIRQISTPY